MSRKDISVLGSPAFHVVMGNIDTGKSQQISLDTGAYKKYAPYDYIEMLNNSTLDLGLVLNDASTFIIPAKSSVTKSDISFRRFKITNDSGSSLTGTDLFVTVQHRPIDADMAARKPKGLFDYAPFLAFLR